MATIVQRVLNSGQKDDGGFGITDDEKEQLIQAMEDLQIKPNDDK